MARGQIRLQNVLMVVLIKMLNIGKITLLGQSPDDARTSMDMAGALDFHMNKVWFQICFNPLPENL